jgi:hypothetical protein
MRYLLFLIVFVLVLSFFCVASFADEGMRILYIKGVVNVQQHSEDFWILARKDMRLNENDRIKTGYAAEAGILLDGTKKNVVTLSQNSEMSVLDMKEKQVSLDRGKIFALIEDIESASSFQVRTPTAVAGVAGSGMSVETDGKNTIVGCFEDRAYVRGINVDGMPMAEIVIIDNGFKRVIGRFEMPGDLIILTMFDRENWQQFRENLRDHLDWLRDRRAEGSRGAAIALDAISRIQERADDSRFDSKENIFERDEHQRRDDWERSRDSGTRDADRDNEPAVNGLSTYQS